MKKRLVVLGILLTIISVSAIGCYTVLTHPMVQGEEAEAIDHTGEYYREHCTDCHGDYHNYPYGFYYGYYPNYYWSSPRWGHYYAYPWWWDRYWWDTGENHYDNETVQPPESSEKADRRRGMVPPYVPPSGSTNTPFVLPNTGTDQQSSQGQQPGTVQPTPMPKQDQEKEQPKDKKAERRRK